MSSLGLFRAWRVSRAQELAISAHARSATTLFTADSTIRFTPTAIRAVTQPSRACGRLLLRLHARTKALFQPGWSHSFSLVLLGAISQLLRFHVAHIAQSHSMQFVPESTSNGISPAPRRVGAGSSLGPDCTALSLMSALCTTLREHHERPNQALQPTATRFVNLAIPD